MSRTRSVSQLVVAAVLATTPLVHAGPPSAKPLEVPGPSAWEPEGCRSVPSTHPVLGSRERWTLVHGDVLDSDEVSTALAPVFAAGWHAEAGFFNVAGPVFDRQGNLYFSPFLPHENVALVSLDPETGARRWAIPGTGAPPGSVSPMVLNDPDHPGQEIVYVALYDRALAVRTDGTVVWDVPTGLTLHRELDRDSVSGINYLPERDAVVGLSTDGHLYLLDRKTG